MADGTRVDGSSLGDFRGSQHRPDGEAAEESNFVTSIRRTRKWGCSSCLPSSGSYPRAHACGVLSSLPPSTTTAISPASGGALPIGSSEHLSRGSLPCGVASVVSRWVVCSPKLHYFPAQDMSTPRARSAFVAVASTSAAALAVWRVLQWRARRKARIVAERAARMVQDGAMVSSASQSLMRRIFLQS